MKIQARSTPFPDDLSAAESESPQTNIPNYPDYPSHPQTIQEFLEYDIAEKEQYLLGNEALWKYGEIIDFIPPSATKSCCFTKAYPRKVEGTGSFYYENYDVPVSFIMKSIAH